MKRGRGRRRRRRRGRFGMIEWSDMYVVESALVAASDLRRRPRTITQSDKEGHSCLADASPVLMEKSLRRTRREEVQLMAPVGHRWYSWRLLRHFCAAPTPKPPPNTPTSTASAEVFILGIQSSQSPAELAKLRPSNRSFSPGRQPMTSLAPNIPLDDRRGCCDRAAIRIASTNSRHRSRN